MLLAKVSTAALQARGATHAGSVRRNTAANV